MRIVEKNSGTTFVTDSAPEYKGMTPDEVEVAMGSALLKVNSEAEALGLSARYQLDSTARQVD